MGYPRSIYLLVSFFSSSILPGLLSRRRKGKELLSFIQLAMFPPHPHPCMPIKQKRISWSSSTSWKFVQATKEEIRKPASHQEIFYAERTCELRHIKNDTHKQTHLFYLLTDFHFRLRLKDKEIHVSRREGFIFKMRFIIYVIMRLKT
jgi:hypothetical protein